MNEHQLRRHRVRCVINKHQFPSYAKNVQGWIDYCSNSASALNFPTQEKNDNWKKKYLGAEIDFRILKIMMKYCHGS